MSANELYWSYNLPLQIWPSEEGCPERILNYMPRKERCEVIELSELLGEQTREEFLNTAATYLENLGRLMRAAAADPTLMVYYHDATGPDSSAGAQS